MARKDMFELILISAASFLFFAVEYIIEIVIFFVVLYLISKFVETHYQ